MSVSLNALACELALKTESDNSIKNNLVNRDSIVTNNYAMGITFLSGCQLPPSMLANVVNSVSFLRIRVENF